jgi:hypothetical protein
MWSIVPGARRIGAFKMGTVNCSVKLDFEISGKFQVSLRSDVVLQVSGSAHQKRPKYG